MTVAGCAELTTCVTVVTMIASLHRVANICEVSYASLDHHAWRVVFAPTVVKEETTQ